MRSRTCCCLAIPVVLVSACLTSLLVYYAATGSGYWENRPPFDRISGPWRFIQNVCVPPPGSLSNVRGGFSGFDGGFIGTSFNFRDDFPPERCLAGGWEARPVDQIAGILWIELSPEAVTRAYVYQDGTDLRYLLLDDDNGRGYLYIP